MHSGIRCSPQARQVRSATGSWCVDRRTGRKHGAAIYLYDSKQKQAAGRYVNGRKHGLWIQWYRTGRVWTRQTFRRGIRHGPSWHYYPSGMMAWSGRFKNGFADGRWQFWDRHGRTTASGTYRQGRQVGTWTWYYPHLGTKRRVVVHFARGCFWQALYDEGGNTDYWVHNVWYGKGVVGNARCRTLWKRRGKK